MNGVFPWRKKSGRELSSLPSQRNSSAQASTAAVNMDQMKNSVREIPKGVKEMQGRQNGTTTGTAHENGKKSMAEWCRRIERMDANKCRAIALGGEKNTNETSEQPSGKSSGSVEIRLRYYPRQCRFDGLSHWHKLTPGGSVDHKIGRSAIWILFSRESFVEMAGVRHVCIAGFVRDRWRATYARGSELQVAIATIDGRPDGVVKGTQKR